ncbi:MAG: methionine--tRNA ligase, partial [Coriobacteriia bacterium]|nr:methionine--tRNA ligase [Coriobacteriia bacterium]
LMHPIVPKGTEKIADYFNVPHEEFFNWEHIFKSFEDFLIAIKINPDEHRFKELPPRTDFFSKHESQYEK